MRYAALGLLLFAACGLDADIERERIPNLDPEYDQRLDDLGIVCQNELSITGVYTQTGAPPPEGTNDCWASGSWVLNSLETSRVGCRTEHPLPETFNYTVSYVDDSNLVTWDDNPSTPRVNLKITTGGGEGCIGKFEHFGEDLIVLSFDVVYLPGVAESGTIEGTGQQAVYLEDPAPLE